MWSIVVYDFCRALNIPVTIYGHDTIYGGSVDLYSFAEFDSLDGNDKYRLMNIHDGGSNRDGCAVRYVAEKLCKRNEQTKLFIVVSDVTADITELQQNLTFKVSAENTLTEVLPFLRRLSAMTNQLSSVATEKELSLTLLT